MRTLLDHIRHMKAVNSNPHLTSHFVRRKSSLNSLELYVLILSLPLDVKHDLLEGIVRLTLKVVHQFIFAMDNVTKLLLLKDFQEFTFQQNQVKIKPISWLSDANDRLTASQA